MTEYPVRCFRGAPATHIRYIVGALLVSIFVAGSPPLPASNTHSTLGALIAPTAEAKNLREKARSLLDRVLGKSMPEGIVKTNGRIEAIQVDVAAKYLAGSSTSPSRKAASQARRGLIDEDTRRLSVT